MQEELVQVPVYFTDYRSRVSGETKLGFETQQNVPPDLMARLLACHQKFGWLCFSAGESRIESDAVADLELPDADSGKSPSRRYRGILYRYWEHLGRPTATFSEFYARHYEKMFDRIAEELG